MLRYFLKDLWGNSVKRIIFLVLVAAVISAVFYRARVPIEQFFFDLFATQVYDDTDTYLDKPPYGFREEPVEAMEYYLEGLEELSELAVELYEADYDSEYLKQNTSAEDEKLYSRSWQSPLKMQPLTEVTKLFEDLQVFCRPFSERTNVRTRFYREEKLKQRHRVYNESGREKIFDYAITESNYNSIRDTLIEISLDYFEMALQKKPDLKPALELQNEIEAAVCRSDSSARWYERALEYREYKTEKNLYRKLREKERNFTPEELVRTTFSQLREDSYYRELLYDFFLRARNTSVSPEFLAMKSLNYYKLTGQKNYLDAYIRARLEICRNSSPAVCKRAFNDLFTIRHKNIESDSFYLYALSETAFRAGRKSRAESLLSHLLSQSIEINADLLRQALRLEFIIELRYEK